ncbi:MAG: ATP-binding protein [Lachnospiraceae bacterium]|nr:ATP-binding protein [Lachnospiraceae bacterium]
MGLTNTQYDEIMRDYQRRQNQARRERSEREQEVYRRIPNLADLDAQIASAGTACARAMLEGDLTNPAPAREQAAAQTERVPGNESPEQSLSAAIEDGRRIAQPEIQKLRAQIATISAQKTALLKEAGFPEDYLCPRYQCPDCEDTGYIGNEKCHCFRQAEIDLLYTQSNLRDSFRDETFSAFSLDWYSDEVIDSGTGLTAAQMAAQALDTCRRFAREFDQGAGNLFLTGNTGLGKTFLTHCIANDLLLRTHSVIYFSAYDLFELLADSSFGRVQPDEAGELERHIFECDLLIIDDLGTEQVNSFVASELFRILNERSLRSGSTMISTNLSLAEIADRYSERVVSRITGSYEMLRLIGDDIRIQKRLNITS